MMDLYNYFQNAKKKREKSSCLNILLIGWLFGLDHFFEGKNEKGISTTIGWTLTVLLFLYGLGLKGYYAGAILIIAVFLILAGNFQACKN